jgi:hypothetical protein
MNNKNEVRQGPAFRALVRGLDETGKKYFLFCFIIIIYYINYSKIQPINHLQNQSKIKKIQISNKNLFIYLLFIVQIINRSIHQPSKVFDIHLISK